MNSHIALLIFMITCSRLFASESPPGVTYRTQPPADHLARPQETVSICKSVSTLLKMGDDPSNEELIGWSLKEIDSDRPPVLLEEAIVLFLVTQGGTNSWILAVTERIVARGRPGTEAWTQSLSGSQMKWFSVLPNRPPDRLIAEFVRQSNFGKAECRPDIIPVHIVIFAPHKYVLPVAEKTVSARDKERRFLDAADIIR